MYGMSDYTYYSALQRKRDRESQEIASSSVGFVYVAKRWASDRMLGYHALAPDAPTDPIDRYAPSLADWNDDQIVDYCALVLSIRDRGRLQATRARLFRLVELHGDAARRPVLDILARALFHAAAPERPMPLELARQFAGAPERCLSEYSMLDMHAGLVAVQCGWFRVEPGPALHATANCLLARMAEIVEFAWDPPGPVLDHPLWVEDGAPSAEFTLLGLSFMADYLRAHRRVQGMAFRPVECTLTEHEQAMARRWLAGAFADHDVYETFKRRYDGWMAGPGLFGMYRTTTREFAYIETSTATVRKRTCLNKIYPRLATIARTPPAEVAALLDDPDALRAACGDAAFLCALGTITPQYNNVNLFTALETHDFFSSPSEEALATRIGGSFFFHGPRVRVHGTLSALKYWLPSLLNGRQLTEDIFQHGSYRSVARTHA